MSQQAFIADAYFPLVHSQTNPTAWALYAPGTDTDDGDIRPLVWGFGEPSQADYREAVEEYTAHWAAEIIRCDGGFQCFESVRDAETWCEGQEQ